MAPLEAKKETITVTRNLQNGRMEISLPGAPAREETAVALLPFYYKRTELVEVHQQDRPRVAKRVNSLSLDEIHERADDIRHRPRDRRRRPSNLHLGFFRAFGKRCRGIFLVAQ